MAIPSPSDSVLEKALRDVVRQAFQRGDNDNITVKRMRTAAEEKLRLQHDFFRYDDRWKARSKEVIEEEAKAQNNSASDLDGEEAVVNSSFLENNGSSPISKPARQKQEGVKEPTNGKKRKAESESDKAPAAKKAKPVAPGGEKKQKALSTKRKTINSDEEGLSETNTPSTPEESPITPIQPVKSALDDESELSDLVDDSPKPKSRKTRKEQKKDASKAKPKVEKEFKTAKATKEKSPDDPDTEKIKSLQGWLLKCGIRKVWGAYLKPYETPKAKIKHLESMLGDVGMTGRFSIEKANQIKEKREMAADLEAVQEGDKKWGKVDSGEESGRPKRRLAKGFQALDFLDDDDGEETD